MTFGENCIRVGHSLMKHDIIRFRRRSIARDSGLLRGNGWETLDPQTPTETGIVDGQKAYAPLVREGPEECERRMRVERVQESTRTIADRRKDVGGNEADAGVLTRSAPATGSGCGWLPMSA